MDRITTKYNVTITPTSRYSNGNVPGSAHLLCEVTSIDNPMPSGHGSYSIAGMSVTINNFYCYYNQIEFILKDPSDSNYLAHNDGDTRATYSGTYTFSFNNILNNSLIMSTGSSYHLHFEPYNNIAFNFEESSTTGYFSITYDYVPPTPQDASTLVLTTKPSEFGGTIVYTINGDNRCTHTFEWRIGSAGNSSTGLGTGSGKTALIPSGWAAQVPSATTGTITVKLTTFYNNSQVGNPVQDQFNVSVPTSMVPSLGNLSISMNSSNATISNWGLYVQGLSVARLTASGASGNTGSTIASYHFLDQSDKEITSINSTATSYTYDAALPSYTGKTFNALYKCYVVDSRGRRSNTVTCSTITVYTYTSPTIGAISAIRCNSEGKVSEDGTYFKLASSFGFTSINGKNLTNCTYQIQWKEHSASSYSHTKTGTITGLSDSQTTYSFVQRYGGASGSSDYMAPNTDYDIKITIYDTLGNSTPKEIALGTISYTMFFKSGGQGVAIGQPTKEAGAAFEVSPEWQMIWGYLDNNQSKPIRIPGVIYTDKNTTLNNNQGRLGMIWLKET